MSKKSSSSYSSHFCLLLGVMLLGAAVPGFMFSITGAPAGNEPVKLRVEVLDTRPHDTSAFTQGLVYQDGALFESTGVYGNSSLREVDPQTGEVRRRLNLPSSIFAEGLALAHGRLTLLTWREHTAFQYDPATFSAAGEFTYSGEGWGLAFDGSRLIMSDGSSRLFFRDPDTFDIVSSTTVTLNGVPRDRINELEYAKGAIYANVWGYDTILKIDPRTGRVLATIDASGLLTADERKHADVLNGIAYDPGRETFLITGKYWPKLFEVRFVPAAR